MAETRDLRLKELLGQHAVLTLPEIQLEFKTHNAGIGMNITKAEVGVLAILDLGNTALAAAELGGHLRLGKTGSHSG